MGYCPASGTNNWVYWLGPILRKGTTMQPRATILIVDNEPFNVDYLEQELADLGYATLSAASGQEALAQMATDAPDLILLDIMMPAMNGFQVLEQLKADSTWRHIPVIIISALSDMSSTVKGIMLGAEDYLSKPFNPTLLRARLRSCLEKKRLHDQDELHQRALRETVAALRQSEAERANALATTRQREAELAIISSVSAALAQQLDFQAIVDLSGSKIQEIFQADTAYLFLNDRPRKLIHRSYYVERGHRHYLPPYQFGEGLASQVIELRQPLHLNEDEEIDAAYAPGWAISSPHESANLNQSYLGAPIPAGEAVLGVLGVQSYQPYAYDENDLRLLTILAANVGMALENARLLEETRQRLNELAVVSRSS